MICVSVCVCASVSDCLSVCLSACVCVDVGVCVRVSGRGLKLMTSSSIGHGSLHITASLSSTESLCRAYRTQIIPQLLLGQTALPRAQGVRCMGRKASAGVPCRLKTPAPHHVSVQQQWMAQAEGFLFTVSPIAGHVASALTIFTQRPLLHVLSTCAVDEHVRLQLQLPPPPLPCTSPALWRSSVEQ